MNDKKDNNLYTIRWSQRMMCSPQSEWIDPEQKSLEKEIDSGNLAEANVELARIMALGK